MTRVDIGLLALGWKSLAIADGLSNLQLYSGFLQTHLYDLRRRCGGQMINTVLHTYRTAVAFNHENLTIGRLGSGLGLSESAISYINRSFR